MSKVQLYAYWISTILVSMLMCYSAWMYFNNPSEIQSIFTTYGYPAYLVIPLAFAKLIGVVVILWRPIKWLTEWAYAGFFFDLLLAVTGHYMAADGSWIFPLTGVILLIISHQTSFKTRRSIISN